MKNIHDGKLNNEMLTDEMVEKLFEEANAKAAPDLWDKIAGNLDAALPETDAFDKADAGNASIEAGIEAVSARATERTGSEAVEKVSNIVDMNDIAEKARAAARETAKKEAEERAAVEKAAELAARKEEEKAVRRSEQPTTILRGSEVPEENKKDRVQVSGRKKHLMKIWIPAIAAAAVLIAAIPAFGLFGKDKAEKQPSSAVISSEASEQRSQSKKNQSYQLNPNYNYESSDEYTFDGDYSLGKDGGEELEAETEEATAAATEAAVEAGGKEETGDISKAKESLRGLVKGERKFYAHGTIFEKDGQKYLKDYQLILFKDGDPFASFTTEMQNLMPDEIRITNPEKLPADSADLSNYDVKLGLTDDGEYTLQIVSE